MNERGQVLIITLAVMLVLALIVPSLVEQARRSAVATQNDLRETRAFELADAAAERGYFRLVMDTQAWDTVQAGGSLPGYELDASYSDVPGGTYAIGISSGALAGSAVVTGVGRDSSGRSVRAVQVTYSSASAAQGAIIANGLSFGGNTSVEWGPIASLSGISLSGNSNRLYPMMFAVGGISGNGGPRGSWNATQAPCTDSKEWWAYDCPPGVTIPPPINFDAYRSSAQAQGLYYTSNQSFTNVQDTAPYTRFFEGDASFSGQTFLWGDLIVMGNASFTGQGKGVYTIHQLPPDAALQYQLLDTAASNEFYGDLGGGPPSVLASTFTFGMGGNPPKSVGLGSKVTVRGFLYCGGALSAAGGSVFHGIVMSPNSISAGGGGLQIFYDGFVTVATGKTTYHRTKWIEIVSAWPAGL
jgi:hypothetical protein